MTRLSVTADLTHDSFLAFRRDGMFQQEHVLFRRSVKAFIEKECLPNFDAWEQAGKTPKDIWRHAGAFGLLSPQVPLEYGGPGGDYLFLTIVNEQAWGLGFTGMNFAAHSDIVTGYLLSLGTEEQKKHWLPKLVSGDCIGAIAMSEPETGSDFKAIRTTAVRDRDHYILNGSKTFISNGLNAGLVIVAAKTSPDKGHKGISLFLVEDTREGFRRGRALDKIGLRAQDTAELFFDDVSVPAENLLGTLDQGFYHAMGELPQERLNVATLALSASQRAFELTVQYVKDRKAFGQAIADFQNTRFALATVKADIATGWTLHDHCVERHMKGLLTAEDAAIAKLWTSEMQGRVADACLQLFGGYGYMKEYPISRIFLDARVQRIYGGTSEIMREIIGRTL